MKVALVIIALVVCSIIVTEAQLAKARRRLGYRAGRRGPQFRNVSAGRRMRSPKSWRDRTPTRNKAGRLTSSATKKGLAKRKRPEQDVKVTSDATNNNATKKNPPEQVGTETEQTTSVTEAPVRGMPPAGGYGGDMGMMGYGMGMDPMMGGGMMGGGMGMGMGGMMSGGKMMTGLLGTMLASQVLGTLATTGSGIATTVLTAKLSQNSGSGTNSTPDLTFQEQIEKASPQEMKPVVVQALAATRTRTSMLLPRPSRNKERWKHQTSKKCNSLNLKGEEADVMEIRGEGAQIGNQVRNKNLIADLIGRR
ncbi:hypothetical protein MTO96_051370, partial [Rhipicephalus appendiculatus]